MTNNFLADRNGINPLAMLHKIYHCNAYNREELESTIDNHTIDASCMVLCCL